MIGTPCLSPHLTNCWLFPSPSPRPKPPCDPIHGLFMVELWHAQPLLNADSSRVSSGSTLAALCHILAEPLMAWPWLTSSPFLPTRCWSSKNRFWNSKKLRRAKRKRSWNSRRSCSDRPPSCSGNASWCVERPTGVTGGAVPTLVDLCCCCSYPCRPGGAGVTASYLCHCRRATHRFVPC